MIVSTTGVSLVAAAARTMHFLVALQRCTRAVLTRLAALCAVLQRHAEDVLLLAVSEASMVVTDLMSN